MDALVRTGLRGRTVLDVGSGAGELTIGCVQHGASHATGMDLGAGAVEVARRSAAEKGLAGRTTFVAADASTAPLGRHDVVVLNRVICCFPDATALVEHTAAAAAAVYAFVVPRSDGRTGAAARAVVRAGNLVYRLRPRKYGRYRAYVHDVDAIAAGLAAMGFRGVLRRNLHAAWHLAVFERA